MSNSTYPIKFSQIGCIQSIFGIVVALACVFAAVPAFAQIDDRGSPNIEEFNPETGTTTVVGFMYVGGDSPVGVWVSESVDVSTLVRTASIRVGRRYDNAAVITPEEISDLLAALDYVSKVNKGYSKYKGFKVTYRTKSDLEMSVSNNRLGDLKFSMGIRDSMRITDSMGIRDWTQTFEMKDIPRIKEAIIKARDLL